MPTPYENATLNLKLFELRRDPELRAARNWFLKDFNPASMEDLAHQVTGERNDWFRMVMGYWDMAASLVTQGAIDADAFLAAHTEITATYAKVEPFLPQIRQASGIPEFAVHMENVVRTRAGWAERTALLREQFRAVAATRKPKES